MAREAGVQLGVCHNFLFEPGVMRALAMLRSGVLGRLVSVDVFWRIRHGARHDRFRTNEWICRLRAGVFQEVARTPSICRPPFSAGRASPRRWSSG